MQDIEGVICIENLTLDS